MPEADARTALDGFVCATPAIGARFPAPRHRTEAAAMGVRGWQAARERFSRGSEAKPLLVLYERLAAGRS